MATSIEVVRKSAISWVLIPDGIAANDVQEAWWRGTRFGDLITFKSTNGAVEFENINYQFISYTDEVTPANDVALFTSGYECFNYLKEQGFFDVGSEGGGSGTTFIGMPDTPASYLGANGHILVVNESGAAVAFLDKEIASSLDELVDGPGVYSNGKYLKSTASGWAWADGFNVDQNNVSLIKTLGSSTSIPTTELAVSRINLKGVMVSEIQTPVIICIKHLPETGTSKLYSWLFKLGKGNWGGISGIEIDSTALFQLPVLNLTPDDIESDPNAIIINIDPVTDGDYVSKANESFWDFSDSEYETGGTSYYFSYTFEGDLYYALFVGTPGTYGNGAPELFTESDFVDTTNDDIDPDPSDNYIKKNPSPDISQTIQGDIEIQGDLKLNPTEATTEDTIIFWDGALSKALKYRPIEWLFNLVLGWLGWDTPQRNGAKGNGIDDDTVAFQQCLSNNQNIFLYGTYLVSGDLNINSNQHIFSNNSTIKRTGTTNTILTANSVSNWKIGGVLTIEGNGNVSGTQRGLYIIGANNFKVDNITFKNISGDPIEFDDTVPSGRGNRGLVYNLSAQNNYGSVLFNRRAEYHTVQNVNISGSSTIALKILSGNVSIIGGSIVDNANGVYLGGSFGNNNSHGVLSNLNINHNDLTGGYNATFENVEEGQTVIGCHFYSEPSGNNINIINSKGIAFTGCIIDGNITNTDATPSNNWTHLFNGCQINTGSNVTGVTQNLIFRDCFTMTGIYSNTPDPTVIQTTTDQTKTGMLTLVGDGPGTLKLQRESFGALFANSSTEDSLTLYDLPGDTAWQRWFSTGNVIIGSSIGTDDGYRLDVQGTFRSTGEATVAPATSATSAPQLQQVVTLTGNQTIADVKTFSSSPIIPDGVAANNPASIGQLNATNAAVTALAARSLVVTGVTAMQTSASLNSAHPSAGVPTYVAYPDTSGSPMIYQKVTTTQWIGYAGVLV